MTPMKRITCLAACLLALDSSHARVLADDGATKSATQQARTGTSEAEVQKQVVAAAQVFIDGLDQNLKTKVLFAFTDQEQRARWSNLPTGIYQRRGVRLGELKAPQREAVMAILRAALSPAGFTKIKGIMDADEYLKLHDRAPMAFGLDEFYISFVGTPSTTSPWLLQFGGHHLAMNLTYAGGAEVMTPTLTAVQPATFPQDGKTMRPLGAENDKAFALVNALDEGQKKQAILGSVMRDLVLGPGEDGKSIQPEGIKASAMTAKQQSMLLEVVQEWVGIAPAAASTAKMAEIKSHLDDTWFLWSGPTDPAKPAYFRIQGPTVWIEFAPQKLGGDATQHIHTIYRDPTNDYGRKLAQP